MEINKEFSKMMEEVSKEKKSEIEVIISQVFSGINLFSIESNEIHVKDHTDVESMQKSSMLRKRIKDARLDTVKILTARRDAVKVEKMEHDLMDKLLLRTIQMIEDLAKNLELSLETREKTRENYFLNLGRDRCEIIKKYDQLFLPDLAKLGEMPEADFSAILFGKKSFFEAEQRRVAEVLEAERLRILEAEAKLKKAEAERADELKRLKAEAERAARAEAERADEIKRLKAEAEAERAARAEAEPGTSAILNHIYAVDFEGSATHFDFVFSIVESTESSAQNGLHTVNKGDVLVTVIRRGGFILRADSWPEYISEKLNIPMDAAEWVNGKLNGSNGK